MWKVSVITGSEVFEVSGRKLGSLKDVLPTGGNDVWVIEQESSSKEILIPALSSIVKKVDIDNKKIIVDLPPGLMDED